MTLAQLFALTTVDPEIAGAKPARNQGSGGDLLALASMT